MRRVMDLLNNCTIVSAIVAHITAARVSQMENIDGSSPTLSSNCMLGTVLQYIHGSGMSHKNRFLGLRRNTFRLSPQKAH